MSKRPSFICARCEHRGKPKSGGACVCARSGKDVIEHQTKTGCPLKLFDAEQALAISASTLVVPLENLPDDENEIVRSVAELSAKSEGLGDTLKKMIEGIGLDRGAKLYEKMTHKKCGCAQRIAWINKWWPYKPTAE